MLLSDHFYLGYVDISSLLAWIKVYQLTEKDFSAEKARWKVEIEREPNFFSDTELLFLNYDVLVLKTLDDRQATFLTQTYQLERQVVCQKLFSENKHIIVLSERQWTQHFQLSKKIQSQPEPEKAIVLLKDEVSIKKSFANWLTKKKT